MISTECIYNKEYMLLEIKWNDGLYQWMVYHLHLSQEGQLKCEEQYGLEKQQEKNKQT